MNLRTVAKDFVIRALTRQFHIFQGNAEDIARIAKLFANAVLESHLEESLGAPRSILVRLPLDTHALFVSTGPVEL